MLTKQQEQAFKAVAHSQDGRIIKEYVENLIVELSGVKTLDPNPIISRQNAIEILEEQLLRYLSQSVPRQSSEVEDYS